MSETPGAAPIASWAEEFNVRVGTAKEAVRLVRPGQRVFLGTGCAQPLTLLKALTERAGELSDVEIVQLFTCGEAPHARPELRDSFRIKSFFVSDNIRHLVRKDPGSYVPTVLSDLPRLFAQGKIPLDVAFIQVTPPNERGQCSLGVSVDVVRLAAENAATVVAQVNPQLPWTHGDSLIHVHDFDMVVCVDEPIIEAEPFVMPPECEPIGELVAALVENGSTIEAGLGNIPQACLAYLHEKEDLGIHTEVLSDHVVSLIESGAVNGRRKSLDRGKVVASFALGSRRLYDFVDRNPMFSFRPTEYVNDSQIISRQNKMVAINAALEIDLTGQVCADSLGGEIVSGIGGQADFNRGALRCPGGKAIIVLPSTAKNGRVSRIVPQLTPGSGVVTTRGDIQYVVTEYGTAYLHGKNLQDRALALISVSHPGFRAELLRSAVRLGYVVAEMAGYEGRLIVEPRNMRTSMVLTDGTQVRFRPVHPTDEPRLRDLFYRMSEATVYYRFGAHLKKLPQRQINEFIFTDHRTEVCLVGTVPEAHGEELIALGAYYLDHRTNRAEVALVTIDEWQNQGIGTVLLQYLAQMAIGDGIRGFTAEIHFTNKPMQAVMHKLGGRIQSTITEQVAHMIVDF